MYKENEISYRTKEMANQSEKMTYEIKERPRQACPAAEETYIKNSLASEPAGNDN